MQSKVSAKRKVEFHTVGDSFFGLDACSNEMLLAVSGSRLIVRRSDTVLPAALNTVVVSSHSTDECNDVFTFRWAILDSIRRISSRIGRGSRNSKYLIFRYNYVGLFRDIIYWFINSSLRVRPGPARYAGGPARKTRPGPVRGPPGPYRPLVHAY
jgi:hypothetical protein